MNVILMCYYCECKFNIFVERILFENLTQPGYLVLLHKIKIPKHKNFKTLLSRYLISAFCNLYGYYVTFLYANFFYFFHIFSELSLKVDVLKKFYGPHCWFLHVSF